MAADPTQPTPDTAPEVSLHLGGLAEGTQLLTSTGLQPVEKLRVGDRLVTRDGGMQPVAFITQRLHASGEVVRVAPQGLGGSPDGPELFLAPRQRVVLRDWRARAVFGRSRALVPVRRLIDGEWIRRSEARNLRLFSIHFDKLRVFYAGDIELGSAAPVNAFLQG